jgi:hypothetical protein
MVADAKMVGNFSTDKTGIKTVTLEQAKVKENVTEPKKQSSFLDQMYNETINGFQKGVSEGIKGFFTDAADKIFEIGGTTNETAEVKDKYGYAVGSVFKIAAYENDPYKSETVQKMRLRTALIGLFIFIIFIFIGAARVNISCGEMHLVDRLQYTITQSVSSFSQYKDDMIIGLAAIIGVHYFFWFIISFNAAITTATMYSVLESIPFDIDNWVMYCAMAICYGFESIFFGLRIILQDLIAGSDILIGALFAISFTRVFAWELVKYFSRITVMQFIIVLLTSFGISIIGEYKFLESFGYFCLIIILILISGGIIFGFRSLFSASRSIVRGHRL